MRFTLVDVITELVPGTRITTVKNVTMAEEYLDDHFPRFPVLPGVFMLEAMTQACAWLIRATDDFADSIVTLQQARNVKYGRFVRPGDALLIKAEMGRRQQRRVQFDVQGYVNGEVAVSGKLTLEHYNLAERRPSMALTDLELKQKLRKELLLKWRNREAVATAS